MGTTNLNDVVVTSLTVDTYAIDAPTYQNITGATGTVTITHGFVVLNRTSAITVTLNNPTATTDDGKRLHIVSLNDVQHVVNLTGGFGNGGSGENVATFSGKVGDGLSLVAWQGYWYITGNQQVVVS
jgi:hypothetical protein